MGEAGERTGSEDGQASLRSALASLEEQHEATGLGVSRGVALWAGCCSRGPARPLELVDSQLPLSLSNLAWGLLSSLCGYQGPMTQGFHG